jgi:hypothetical protein
VSTLIDLIGKARGNGTGRGGGGQRTQGRGIIVPCAFAATAEIKQIRENRKRLTTFLISITNSLRTVGNRQQAVGSFVLFAPVAFSAHAFEIYSEFQIRATFVRKPARSKGVMTRTLDSRALLPHCVASF